MPRTKTFYETREENRTTTLKKWLVDAGIKNQHFGKVLGAGQQLGYHRLQRPSNLTIEELFLMSKVQGLTDRQIVCLVRGLKYEEEPQEKTETV